MTEEKNQGGRPTKYTEDLPDKLIEYFKGEDYFPTVEGFCSKILISKQTFHRWLDDYSQFSDAYGVIKQMQKHNLIDGALNKKYDSGFSKFFAINNLDMKEKSETEMYGKDGASLGIEVTFVGKDKS